MEPGKLDKRITILRKISTPDNMGGLQTELSTIATVWAEKLRPRFKRSEIQGAPATEITQGFRLRAGISILIDDKLQLSGQLYTVLHVDDSNKHEIILTTREVAR